MPTKTLKDIPIDNEMENKIKQCTHTLQYSEKINVYNDLVSQIKQQKNGDYDDNTITNAMSLACSHAPGTTKAYLYTPQYFDNALFYYTLLKLPDTCKIKKEFNIRKEKYNSCMAENNALSQQYNIKIDYDDPITDEDGTAYKQQLSDKYQDSQEYQTILAKYDELYNKFEESKKSLNEYFSQYNRYHKLSTVLEMMKEDESMKEEYDDFYQQFTEIKTPADIHTLTAKILISLLKNLKINSKYNAIEQKHKDWIYELLYKSTDYPTIHRVTGYITGLSQLVQSILNQKSDAKSEELETAFASHLIHDQCLGDLYGQVFYISSIAGTFVNQVAAQIFAKIVDTEWQKLYRSNITIPKDQQHLHWVGAVYNILLEKYQLDKLPKEPTNYLTDVLVDDYKVKLQELVNNQLDKTEPFDTVLNNVINWDIPNLITFAEELGLEKVLQILKDDENSTLYPKSDIQEFIKNVVVLITQDKFNFSADTVKSCNEYNNELFNKIKALQITGELNTLKLQKLEPLKLTKTNEPNQITVKKEPEDQQKSNTVKFEVPNGINNVTDARNKVPDPQKTMKTNIVWSFIIRIAEIVGIMYVIKQIEAYLSKSSDREIG